MDENKGRKNRSCVQSPFRALHLQPNNQGGNLFWKRKRDAAGSKSRRAAGQMPGDWRRMSQGSGNTTGPGMLRSFTKACQAQRSSNAGR